MDGSESPDLGDEMADVADDPWLESDWMAEEGVKKKWKKT